MTSSNSQAILTDHPELYGLPPYPKSDVVGPCVCGSWPGGKCLKCAVIPARADRRNLSGSGVTDAPSK